MQPFMTLFSQKVPKLLFPCVNRLFKLRGNMVYLKRKHRVFNYSLHVKAMKGWNVCTPPECSIFPQETLAKIIKLLVV